MVDLLLNQHWACQFICFTIIPSHSTHKLNAKLKGCTRASASDQVAISDHTLFGIGIAWWIKYQLNVIAKKVTYKSPWLNYIFIIRIYWDKPHIGQMTKGNFTFIIMMEITIILNKRNIVRKFYSPSNWSFTDGCEVTVFPFAMPWAWRAVGAIKEMTTMLLKS